VSLRTFTPLNQARLEVHALTPGFEDKSTSLSSTRREWEEQ
jgi:hypothetical protein